MPRDLESLELEVGKFESEMNDEAGKIHEHMDAVRAKAPDVFKRVRARVDAKGKTVDRIDAVLSSLDRVNQSPTSTGSPNGSGNLSGTTREPVTDSSEKKT